MSEDLKEKGKNYFAFFLFSMCELYDRRDATTFIHLCSCAINQYAWVKPFFLPLHPLPALTDKFP